MPKTSLQSAIRLAKEFVLEAFGDEELFNLGLEEIRFDDREASWKITLGFSRHWDSSSALIPVFPAEYKRVYKVVTINDETGQATSITQRDIAA